MRRRTQLANVTAQSSRSGGPVRGRSARGSTERSQIGNHALQEQLRSNAVRPKLSVSQPGDRDEREADQAAEAVMRMPGRSGETLLTSQGLPNIQRMCTECEEEEEVQRKPGAGDHQADSDFSHPSGGQPLPASERSFFEPRFGTDFEQVRIHTGEPAAAAASSINALAYTKGNDVVFGDGQYRPGTHSGRTLLGHELAHVVQQRSSGATTLQRQADLRHAPPGLNTRCNLIPNVPARGGGLEVLFPVDSSVLTLTAAQNTALTTFVDNWHAAGSFDDLLVQGFASHDGLPGPNWTLSCERAEALRGELVRRGISIARISTQAHGDSTAATTGPGNRRAVLSTLPRPTATTTPITTRPAVGASCPVSASIEVSRGNDDERECEYEDARIRASVVVDRCACAGGAPIPIRIEYLATLFGKSFQDAAQTIPETQASGIASRFFFLREENTANDSPRLRHSGDIGRPADPDDTLTAELTLLATVDCLGGSRTGRVLVRSGGTVQQNIDWGVTADSTGVQAITVDITQLAVPRGGQSTILPPLRSAASPYPNFPGVPRDNRCSCHPVTGEHQGTGCPPRFLFGRSGVGVP